jgi:hypothetical protein
MLPPSITTRANCFRLANAPRMRVRVEELGGIGGQDAVEGRWSPGIRAIAGAAYPIRHEARRVLAYSFERSTRTSMPDEAWASGH